jgi:hypothetical protein
MMKIKNLLLLAILALGISEVKAQDKEWGGFLGISVYSGDLSQSPIPIRGSRPAIGGLYRYNFNTHWAIKTGLNIGYIASYDRYSGEGTLRESRNLSFHSPLVELSVVGEYNFMKYVAGSRKYKFTPYVFGGVAGFYFNPQTFYLGTNYNLRDFVTEESKQDGVYSPLQIAIPMGIGFKYSLGRKKLWNLGFEFGWRKTFTDYLDDVSDELPSNYNTTLPQEDRNLAYRGFPTEEGFWDNTWKRGNPDSQDSYYFFGITITKTIRQFSCRF